MPDRFSLVRWRDAETDPPEDYKVVKTDVGYAYVGHDRDWMLVSLFESMYAGHELAWPSVWCDPSPPGDDAPKADDLRSVLGYVEEMLAQVGPIRDENVVAFRRQVARLRRAIEEGSQEP